MAFNIVRWQEITANTHTSSLVSIYSLEGISTYIFLLVCDFAHTDWAPGLKQMGFQMPSPGMRFEQDEWAEGKKNRHIPYDDTS